VTTENIFNGQDQATETATQVATPPTTQGNGEIVSALVGEGQKYKTVDELAKAYLHADTFIQQLKEENQKYREQVASAKSIDDVLERLQQSQQQEQVTPAQVEQPDISALVEQTLAQREAKKAQEANLLEVDEGTTRRTCWRAI
jgi:cysteinyl-tRNA synthetase